MKIGKILLLATTATFLLSACKTEPNTDAWIKHAIDVSSAQLLQTAKDMGDSLKLPRSVYAGYDIPFLSKQLGKDSSLFADSLRPFKKNLVGKIRYCNNVYDWTSGFYPGSLWYAYELTGKEEFKDEASKYTALLYPVRLYKDSHDVGFMIDCSYGNQERIMHNDTVIPIIIQTANNLIARYNKRIGCIRSWDFGPWNFPVIIDNMMNLNLLFNASRLSGDASYRAIALRHADTTMKNHFRKDYSSYHVVSYRDDGSVETQCTFQGKSDDSHWARGQAWGLYGFVNCYRETKDPKYLKEAENIAHMIMDKVKTNDAIPYWDYDAPDMKETPRDASAAAVTASALFELSTYVSSDRTYFNYGERILKSLCSDNYLAKKGENNGFVLMHSTGSLPNGSEIDVPLNYADYYFMESLVRYMKIKGLTYKNLK
jgi:hypothetical protein